MFLSQLEFTQKIFYLSLAGALRNVKLHLVNFSIYFIIVFTRALGFVITRSNSCAWHRAIAALASLDQGA